MYQLFKKTFILIFALTFVSCVNTKNNQIQEIKPKQEILTGNIQIYNKAKNINKKSLFTVKIDNNIDIKQRTILKAFINTKSELIYSVKVTWLNGNYLQKYKKARTLLYATWPYEIRKTKKNKILLFKGGKPIKLLTDKEKIIPSKINIIMKKELKERVNLYLSLINTHST